MTESGYALIYFSLEFNCHIRCEITCYYRCWQSCTLNLSYHAKRLGRNLDPKQARTIRSSKAAIATREVWTFKSLLRSHACHGNAEQYVPEYPRGILFWDLACVCACVRVCVTQDAMKILCGCMGCRDNRGCQDSDSFLCRRCRS